MFRHIIHRGFLSLLGLAGLFCFSTQVAMGQVVTGFHSGLGGVSAPFGGGGFANTAGLGGGFGIHTGHFGANLGFNFSQGYSRSMTSSSPFVTGFNGSPAFFQNSVQRPFVTNLIPTVGNGAMFSNLGPVDTIPNRVMQGELSMPDRKVVPAEVSRRAAEEKVQVARRANPRPLVDAAPPTRAEREAQQTERQAEQQLAIRNYLQKGQAAEAEGKRSVAKLYYQMAARRAAGKLKQEALASLNRVRN